MIMWRRSLESVICLVVALKFHSATAAFCQNERVAWQCACGCCEEYDYCCVSCASYWYAWLIMTIVFLGCLCACLGCGSYGYRRYRTPHMSSFSIAQTPRYLQPPSTYETAKLNTNSPNSQPYAAMATCYPNNRNQGCNMGCQGNQAMPQGLPPPYNPSHPPPPYSTH